ncbi:hypothetical protein ACFY5D_19120 [Paeniglutamicibacter sp. NPDC012692]|uniref:hypothetical protein n=1 Tax=Paeniglutamicibacter sp. NPDC012692 TaxID=3364388 RepID=UPI00367B8B62
MKLTLAIGALASLLLTSGSPGLASSSVVKRSLNPERIFRIDPPAQDQAIQAFDHGAGKDVYMAQAVGQDTRLSRCTRTATGTCTQKDSVMLKGYGHGESLEVYTKNGRTYVWIGSTSNGIPPYYFSRTISLIQYKKAPSGSKKASYHRVGMLKNLAAIVPGNSGNAIRSNIALADGDDRLAISITVGSSNYYAVYKTAALTGRMLNAPGQKLSISKAKDLMVSRFKEPARPHGSFQGFDIKGVGTNKKFLYVFGGPVGTSPTIYRYAYTNGGKITHDRTYVIKGVYLGSLESEGIKVEADPTSGGKVRVMHSLNPTNRDSAGRKIFRLYRFKE